MKLTLGKEEHVMMLFNKVLIKIFRNYLKYLKYSYYPLLISYYVKQGSMQISVVTIVNRRHTLDFTQKLRTHLMKHDRASATGMVQEI